MLFVCQSFALLLGNALQLLRQELLVADVGQLDDNLNINLVVPRHYTVHLVKPRGSRVCFEHGTFCAIFRCSE